MGIDPSIMTKVITALTLLWLPLASCAPHPQYIFSGPVVSPYMVPLLYPMYPHLFPLEDRTHHPWVMGVYHAPEDIITEDGLKIEVLSTSVNCPRYVSAGDLLTVHYTGYFLNGEIFESSRDVPEEKDPELPEEELKWNFDDGNSGFNPGTENDVQGEREGRQRYHIGKRKVILGWDQGLIGKCVHDKLRLTIPPQLAY